MQVDASRQDSNPSLQPHTENGDFYYIGALLSHGCVFLFLTNHVSELLTLSFKNYVDTNQGLLFHIVDVSRIYLQNELGSLVCGV